MTIRRIAPAAVAALGVLALAVAVAALAAQQDDKSVKSAATHPPCAPPSPGNHQIVVEDGRPAVLVHVPHATPPGRSRRPLVLVLPGAGMTGADMARYTGYSRLADLKGFLVAYPTASGTRPFWNVSTKQPGKPDDVGYLRRVIGALTGDTGCADPARVGVTGVSNGGGMSALLACRAADLLAAAAPVAGGYSTLPDCEPARPLPVLEIHGLRDEVVPYTGDKASHAGAVGPYVDEWRARDRCPDPPRRSAPAHNVLELRWTCADGRVVAHDRVIDAEHGWPGESSLKPFSSTLRTWRFLNAFRDELRG
jgi:polyhydroxybutyrate depolymerase